MRRSILRILIRGIEYGALPFLYPRYFWKLWKVLLRQRALLHELPGLTEYRHWFQAKGIQTVIDVGAYLGSFSWAMQLILPQVQIYAFEALEENYRALIANLGERKDFRAFHVALGERQGTIEFYRDNFTASSSVLPMGELHRRVFSQTGQQERIAVPQARLDDYLEQMELRPPVLLKLDVQGYELNVLRGAEQTLQKVDWVICEASFYELYVDQPLFDEIYNWLRARGFRYLGSLGKLLSPLDGRILQEDALFSREQSM